MILVSNLDKDSWLKMWQKHDYFFYNKRNPMFSRGKESLLQLMKMYDILDKSDQEEIREVLQITGIFDDEKLYRYFKTR